MNASEGCQDDTPSGAPFRIKDKASWVKAKWPSTKTCFAFDQGKVYNTETVVTHTGVDAVVAPTYQQDVIGSNPKPTLSD